MIARIQLRITIAVMLSATLINASCSSQTSPAAPEQDGLTQQVNTPSRDVSSRDNDSRDNDSRDNDSRDNDWPRFRGPSGMGVSQAAGLPVT